MKALLDTNIVLRNVNVTDANHAVVKAFLMELAEKGYELCICSQTVYEFWVVATRPLDGNGLGLDVQTVREKVQQILNAFSYIVDPPNLFERWLALCTFNKVVGKQAHDARLVALMSGAGIANLVTLYDQHFARYTDVRILVPGVTV